MKKTREITPDMDYYYDLYPVIEDRVKEDIREHLNLDDDVKIDIMDYREEFEDVYCDRCWEYLFQLNDLKRQNGYGRTKMKNLHIDYLNLTRGFVRESGLKHNDFQYEKDDLPF